MYRLLILRTKEITNECLSQHKELYLVFRGDLNGKENQKEGKICICAAGSTLLFSRN